MASIAKRVFKAGFVLALDSKFTGDEPLWQGWEDWELEKFFGTQRRMIRFYSYYLTHADLRPGVLDYMKDEKFSKTDIQLMKNGNPTVLAITVGKLVRAMKMGMPSKHPRAQEYFDALPFHNDPENPPIAPDHKDVVNAGILDALRIYRNLEKPQDVGAVAVQKPKFISVQDRLKEKVNREVIIPLEEMLDKWIENRDSTKIEGLAMTSYIRDSKIPAAGCKIVLEWLDKLLEEYQGAYEKTDAEFTEGLSYLTRPALRNRVAAIESMIAEVKAAFKQSKAAKKTRVKKPKDAAKQIVRLKYQPESKEYGLTSVNPLRIPTAHRALFFNTKYRTLSVYFSNSTEGFMVQGTSLKNFDVDTSYTLTLRKPKESLNAVINATPKQIEKILDGVKSKRRPAKGRINPQTIIVRTIETR
jgi:hypothetical protein